MRELAKRIVRGILLGLVFGASTVLLIRFVSGIVGSAKAFTTAHIPAPLLAVAAKFSHYWAFASTIVLGSLILLAPQIISFARRLFRSWLAGLTTLSLPVWFVITLVLFLRIDQLSRWRVLALMVIGLLPIVSAFLLKYRSTQLSLTPVLIPDVKSSGESLMAKDIEFDLPIHQWSEDRLNRAPFIRSIANLILIEKAPVIAIVGSFGEGKTSVLNLLEITLADRKDVAVVSFSSWLPGDERTLAASLFATIAGTLKSRFIIPGLTTELKKFGRLLAGTVPRFGDTLKQFFEESSQVNQLSSLKGVLNRLPLRIVVLVDEADRMDEAELRLLLKAVRGVVDLPNITYVCAFDKKAITGLISNDDPFYGQTYLEKFFPVQLSLPRTDQELLGRLFDERLEAICQTFELLQSEQQKKAFNESLLEIWHTSIKRYLSNFRRMTLFFNALQMSLQPVFAEVNLFDMLILQLVKMISEETYQFIYDNGPLFYYSRWRITLWLERLHVDDKKEAALRGERIKSYLSSLSPAMKGQLTPLLSAIFPTVEQAIRGERFSMHVQSEDAAEKERRIYHPDYFPRYFIHQVPSAMFGRAEMTELIARLNAERELERVVAIFRETVNKLQSNTWKRYGLFDTFVAEAGRLGEAQSEGVILAVADLSDSFEGDFLGISEWGRARALLFAAAQRFEGTPKLQEILIKSIHRCSSNAFAADILGFSTSARQQNNIISNWQGVGETALKTAYSERMRAKYRVESEEEFPYRRDDLRPFFIWVNASDQDKQQEIAFFRDRFQRHPVERGKFLGWALPKTTVVYEGDPLLNVERLFPLDELVEALGNREEDQWSDQERESVQWFLELMQQRNNRAAGQEIQPDEPSAEIEIGDIDAGANSVDEDQELEEPDDPVNSQT